MKKLILSLKFALCALVLTACSEDDSAFNEPLAPQVPTDVSRATFPEDDGSPSLSSYSPNEKVARLLSKVSDAYAVTDTLGRANITPGQYAEIKAFTDDLVKNCKTQKEAFDVCFKWVSTNIEYDYVDNDPYAVFINRKGICQGYANLLFIMLHSQGIPSMVCNGILNPIGGHAWNYACCDGKWYAADPTNTGGPWGYRLYSSFSHLIPMSLDIVIYKDKDCWFDYNEYNLNICNITGKGPEFTVPFSVNGYQVSSLSPNVPISPSIKKLYIGKNIVSLGENQMGLQNNAPNVEYVEIDPANAAFASYLGVVYRKSGSDFQLTYIPGAMQCVELMPMETIYKNTIYRHDAVEVLIVAPGTKYIESWGVENCPNLKVAYIPKDTEVAENAFAGVHPDFQIIRGDFTNIPDVKED